MYIHCPYPPPYDARPHHNRTVSVVPARPAPSSLPPPSPARPAAPVAEPAATVARATRPPWIEEPGSGEPFNYVNYVALPAIGATAVILDFTVPEGRNGAIKWIGNNFVGGGWVEGTGAVVWRILRDDGFMKNHENLLGSLEEISSENGVMLPLVAYIPHDPSGCSPNFAACRGHQA